MSEVLKQKIRRDLSRWSRKLLLCVGLESIGRELVGEENWRHLFPVSSDWERDKKSPVSDFDPSGPTPSPRPSEHIPCQALTPDPSHLDPSTSPMTDEEEDDEPKEERIDGYESLAHLLPYWYFINRAFGVPSVGGAGKLAEDLNDRSANPLLEALDAHQLNALLLLHSLKQQEQLQVQVQAGLPPPAVPPPFTRRPNLQEFKDPHELLKSVVGARGQRPGRSSGPGLLSLSNDPGHSFSEDLDQPLDLTQKRKIITEKPVGKSVPLVPPEVTSSNIGRDVTALERYSKFNVKSSPRVGRGYTTQELEAALSDIQSGKLGTRRAAVIYGIPRSTLRNKVYKLGKDRSRPHRSKEKLVSEVALRPELGSERRVLRRDSLKPDLGSNFGHSSAVPKGSTTQQPTAGPGGGEDEAKSEEEISREKKALKEWLHTKLSRQRLNNLESSNIEYLSNGGDRLLPPPALGNTSDSNCSDCSDETNQDFGRNVLNTAPVSLDTRNYDTPRRRLKRRFYEDGGEQSPRNSQPQSQASTVTFPMDIVPDWKTVQVKDEDCSMDESERGVGKARQDYYDTFDQDGNMSDGDGNEKKSRPKRGKYRNYDRDALLKAVKAVQQGEMSVHRAGSHFGVPHSTLEYKVKERHLLRRPKRKENNGNPKPSQKSSPDSSLSGSEPGSRTPRMEFSPVASSTRETLSRFLNSGEPRSSQGSLPGSDSMGSRALRHQRLPKDSVTIGGRSPSPFHLHDLLRRSFDNSSLFDMTKMS